MSAMNSRTSILTERDGVSFPVYVYPFEATNIAPGHGGSNVDDVFVDGAGVEIAKRKLPSEWNMVCEDALWWISLEQPWLQHRDLQIPSNSTQYELAFFVTALNLCVDTEVFFARFARREYQSIIHNGETISPSSGFQLAEILQRPVPNTIVIDGSRFTTVLDRVFEDVLLVDDHSDLSKAVETYRAAIQSFHTEVHVRLLYSVCENALFTGSPAADEKDRKIAEISSLEQDEAEAWRHLVNRTKHPDEGTPYEWEDTFEEVPPPVELRM